MGGERAASTDGGTPKIPVEEKKGAEERLVEEGWVSKEKESTSLECSGAVRNSCSGVRRMALI